MEGRVCLDSSSWCVWVCLGGRQCSKRQPWWQERKFRDPISGRDRKQRRYRKWTENTCSVLASGDGFHLSRLHLSKLHNLPKQYQTLGNNPLIPQPVRNILIKSSTGAEIKIWPRRQCGESQSRENILCGILVVISVDSDNVWENWKQGQLELRVMAGNNLSTLCPDQRISLSLSPWDGWSPSATLAGLFKSEEGKGLQSKCRLQPSKTTRPTLHMCTDIVSFKCCQWCVRTSGHVYTHQCCLATVVM